MQIVVFIISTVAAGTRFSQWWRLGDSRFKIWRFYGHFTFLMVTGSAFGVASSILYGNFAVAAFEVQDVQGASDGEPAHAASDKRHARSLMPLPQNGFLYGVFTSDIWPPILSSVPSSTFCTRLPSCSHPSKLSSRFVCSLCRVYPCHHGQALCAGPHVVCRHSRSPPFSCS